MLQLLLHDTYLGNWTREYICLEVDNSTLESYGPFHIHWPMALHNIEKSEDHFVICQDSTKSDKQGEKTHKKAVYCDPSNPFLCPGVSLGVWNHWTKTPSEYTLNAFYLSWYAHLQCCSSLMRAASSYNESVLGYCADKYQNDICTWHKKRQRHTCVMCNNDPTTNCLNCESGRLVCGESTRCLLAVCQIRRSLPRLLPMWAGPQPQYFFCTSSSLDRKVRQ